MQALEIISKDF